MPETIRFAVIIEAVIDDHVAVAASDVSIIRDDAAGTEEPFIMPAVEVVQSTAMRGAALAIHNLPGARCGPLSVVPVTSPWITGGSTSAPE